MQENGESSRADQAMQLLAELRHEIGAGSYKRVTLGNVLRKFGGAQKPLDWHYDESAGAVVYSIDGAEHRSEAFEDALSGTRTFFATLPIAYVHHDGRINPRGINLSLEGLVREFDCGNPQLQPCLARTDGAFVKVFDGQHKAVARILLGERDLLLRIFIEPDVPRLMETNARAGGALKQVDFDGVTQARIASATFQEKVHQYQREHGLDVDDISFLTPAKVKEFLGGTTFLPR